MNVAGMRKGAALLLRLPPDLALITGYADAKLFGNRFVHFSANCGPGLHWQGAPSHKPAPAIGNAGGHSH